MIMTKKYKILGKYIKDMSSEAPDIETYIFVFFLIFPISRNFLLKKFFYKFKKEESETEKKNFIDGEFEDIEDDNDKKI